MQILNKEFYKKYTTIELSKALIGKYLVHETADGITSGRIVETEAYLHNDPAAHSYIGKTQRNKSVFEEAGTSYVYFIYGMYFCFNVSSNEKDIGEAVLIRALEPIEGIEVMKCNLRKRRKGEDKSESYNKVEKLCNGPGKLCIAMNITRSEDGLKLWQKPLYLAEDENSEINPEDIITTKRIGIVKAAEMPYRFYLKGSKFVSA